MRTIVALVGMQHRGTSALVASLPQGEPLLLVREPDNKFDRFAVQVWAREVHVGYIKSSQVRPVAMAMDSNPALVLAPSPCGLKATLAIDGGKWPMVQIDDEPKKAPPDVG